MNSAGTPQGEFVHGHTPPVMAGAGHTCRCVFISIFCSLFAIVASPAALRAQPSPPPVLIKMHKRAPEFPRAVPRAVFPSSPSLPEAPGQQIPSVIRSPAAEGPAPGMEQARPKVVWINSRPLSMTALRGKVVMIDFWEYTCINCIRTLGENRKWYRRYHKYGFEIIGVHCPEFDFAYQASNVRKAVKRFKLHYPVVVDDHFLIWNAYHNRSWPGRFLIDAKGFIRYHRIGEGGDDALEHAIQKLLKEAHPGLKFPASYKIPPEKNAFAPSCGVTTPEMYIGFWHGRGALANRLGYHKGKTLDYKLPSSLKDGQAAVSGRWEADDGRNPNQSNGMIYRGKKKGHGPSGDELEMRYHARQLYSVMNVEDGHPERVYIRQDGKDLKPKNKGVDVQFDSKGHSYIEVREPRMYYLVANPTFGPHKVQLFPTRSGLTINSFTFGNNCQTNFPHL